jgi:hypothetical protein
VDQPSFHQETHDFWNQNAAFWDKFTGEGTSWHIELIDPAGVGCAVRVIILQS